MGKNLTPVWGGIVWVIAYMSGLLVATTLFLSEPDARQGLGLMVMYFMLPIVFVLVLAVSSAVLMGLFGLIKDDSTRSIIIIAAVGVFLTMYGIPSLLALFIGGIFYLIGNYYTKKAQTDQQDLSQFLEK